MAQGWGAKVPDERQNTGQKPQLAIWWEVTDSKHKHFKEGLETPLLHKQSEGERDYYERDPMRTSHLLRVLFMKYIQNRKISHGAFQHGLTDCAHCI